MNGFVLSLLVTERPYYNFNPIACERYRSRPFHVATGVIFEWSHCIQTSLAYYRVPRLAKVVSGEDPSRSLALLRSLVR